MGKEVSLLLRLHYLLSLALLKSFILKEGKTGFLAAIIPLVIPLEGYKDNEG